MAFKIRTNTTALNALNSLGRVQDSLKGSFSRVSSGLRITKAADDAAGLAVAENLDSKQRSLRQAMRNAHDGVSVVQTIEGAVNEVANIVKRVRELAVQSSSGTLTSTERGYIHAEWTSMRSEIDRISSVTEFNGIALGAGGTLDVQVGTNDTTDDRLTIQLADVSAGAGLAISTVSLSTASSSQAALARLDTALNTLNSNRAEFGATQNRLSSALNNLGTYTESLAVAESGIRDADLAFESSEMIKQQIMQDAAVSVLAQANMGSRGVLSLLN